MKPIALASLLTLAACGVEPLPPEAPLAPPSETVVATVETRSEAIVAPGKEPRLVEPGMTYAEVLAIGGSPEWTRAPDPSDPNYLATRGWVDMIWAYEIPSCGAFYVFFYTGVVTSRGGRAGGCDPL